MKLKDIVTLETSSVNPQNKPESIWHLYSLPSFDEGKQCEQVLGKDIMSNKYLVPNKCILFNKLNVRFKRIWAVFSSDEYTICSTEFLPLVVNEDVADFDFVYHLLHSDQITNYLTGQNTNTSGSHKRIDPTDFLNIDVIMPSIEEQKRIGAILSNIERKIDLNSEINQNLEAMAKQLYDYWFLQYEFPNDEGKPYKSSGGTLCTDEQTGRSIPSDWNSCKLSNIENVIVTGKTPSTQDETNFGDDVPFITIDDIRRNLFIYETERSLSTKGAETQRNKYLTPGSLCCSCIGTVGVIGFVGRKAQTNQQINSIDFQNEANREYLYFSLKLHFQYADAKTGNTFANMNKDEFCNIPIINPKAELVSLFHTRTCPLFKEIDNNIKEINALQKQRDQLLPLLINGQVSVTQLNSDLSHD